GKPARALAVLERPYEQRAWIQLPDERVRMQYMELICNTLIEAYHATGNILKAEDVRMFLSHMGVLSAATYGAEASPTMSSPRQ
ncbi:MAG: hypothetical protein D6747_08840, partial [Chlorobiota bacterium]